eukprot:jgi/Mesen1/10242/ME000774S09576
MPSCSIAGEGQLLHVDGTGQGHAGNHARASGRHTEGQEPATKVPRTDDAGSGPPGAVQLSTSVVPAQHCQLEGDGQLAAGRNEASFATAVHDCKGASESEDVAASTVPDGSLQTVPSAHVAERTVQVTARAGERGGEGAAGGGQPEEEPGRLGGGSTTPVKNASAPGEGSGVPAGTSGAVLPLPSSADVPGGSGAEGLAAGAALTRSQLANGAEPAGVVPSGDVCAGGEGGGVGGGVCAPEFEIDPMCTHCPNIGPHGYEEEIDGLWLHCVRYSGTDWSYECPAPPWGR